MTLRARTVAAVAAAFAVVPAALAQPTITLWGQTYDVQRFDYFQSVTWPSPVFVGDTLQLFEVEGTYYAGNNKLYLSADDISDVFIGNPDNYFVEVDLLTSGGTVTGIAYSRTLATVDAALQAYDPNPGGLTVNTGTTGLGADGGLIVMGNEGYFFGYALSGPSAGQQLPWPTAGANCPINPLGCAIDISVSNFNAEDVAFIPALGSRQAQFAAINQDLGGTDIAGVERYSTSGTLLGTFNVGGAVQPGLAGAVAKGLTFSPDSSALPAAIRSAGGVIFVSFDRDFPALQAFDASGVLLGTEWLTTNQLPAGPRRLDNTDAIGAVPLHLESLAVDPASGRLFLVNQGVLSRGNWIWVLTPQGAPAGCNRADLTDIGDTGAGPDNQLTVDDIIAFVNTFGDATGCPGTAPCNRADVTDIGDTGAGPDGELTVDDIIAFVNAFGDGC